ncbi:DUF721 domain-containing protein [Methylophilaceae bacterium]|jgi:hypothetical protein|nr:DUF721 domain-containing protein [Methylophilaceae bacterium]
MEPIKKLFQSSFFLEINKRKNRLDLLQKEIAIFIPNDLVSLISIKSLVGRTLIVDVKSNAVAHKLKLQERKILDSINQKSEQGELLNKIKVRIIIQNKKIDKKLKVKSIYPIKKLRNLVHSIKDSPLKTSLNKLIKSRND